KVPILARSSRPGTKAVTRSFISSAALFVNVNARTRKVTACIEQTRDAAREYLRFARTWTGEDQHRAAAPGYGFALDVREFNKCLCKRIVAHAKPRRSAIASRKGWGIRAASAAFPRSMVVSCAT